MININTYDNLRSWIFNVDENNFESLSIEVFHYQYANNALYQKYCDLTIRDISTINHLHEIPFLPIQFFKTQQITTGTFEAEAIFESSGTTGSINSKHYVKDLNWYTKSFLEGFDLFYGNIEEYCILGLLPSYLERKNSSLVCMVNELINRSKHELSGFHLYDHQKLHEIIKSNEANQQKTLLIGVSYALLDFAESYPMKLNNTIVMETGGMKGKREEMTKQALHQSLIKQFEVEHIHSEYGMTELLSQAYSFGKCIFSTPPWMKILLRSEDNPLQTFQNVFKENKNKRGVVNVIDLANIDSCCFIATEDTGINYADGTFEITGRLNNSDIRGCGLMII
jgi:hypothetical protein